MLRFFQPHSNFSMANIAVVYYSSTGSTYRVAQAIEAGASAAGANVRLRKVQELASPQTVSSKPAWSVHLEETRDIPEASAADMEWADGYAFGSPTRFGLPAAQLKQFIDTLGPSWAASKLQDKAACAFTGAGNPHGGQESTLLAMQNMFFHWGAVLVPPGYTDPSVKAAGGNPYGTSFTAKADGSVSESVLAAARHQGRRIAMVAAALAVLRGSA